MTHEISGDTHKGRLRSWLAVGVTIAGFLIGGVALTLGPNWLIFWIGAGVVVVGGIAAYASGIMKDTVIDDRHPVPPA